MWDPQRCIGYSCACESTTHIASLIGTDGLQQRMPDQSKVLVLIVMFLVRESASFIFQYSLYVWL